MSKKNKLIIFIIEFLFSLSGYFLVYLLLKDNSLLNNFKLFEIMIISGCVSQVIIRVIMIIIYDRRIDLGILIISFIILIYMLLFNRNKMDKVLIENDFYLDKWIKGLFSNKIIFINIIGNIILFVPLGFIIKKIIIKVKYNNIITILIGIIIIILIECLQLMTKRGIFDVTDVILNSIGLSLGLILIKERKEVKYE